MLIVTPHESSELGTLASHTGFPGALRSGWRHQSLAQDTHMETEHANSDSDYFFP